MLHTLFGTTIQSDIKQLIFKYATTSSTSNVINTLSRNNINPSSASLVDDFDQNLLHIAVKTKNYELTKYLVKEKTSMTKLSLFYETPYDIAIKNQDKKMIEILLSHDEFNFYKNEVARLNNTLSDSKHNNNSLIVTNKDLTIKNSTLQVQLSVSNTKLEEEKRSNKRKFEEYENCFRENKRLKTDNTKLQYDNTTLQNTVTSLRNSMKK